MLEHPVLTMTAIYARSRARQNTCGRGRTREVYEFLWKVYFIECIVIETVSSEDRRKEQYARKNVAHTTSQTKEDEDMIPAMRIEKSGYPSNAASLKKTRCLD